MRGFSGNGGRRKGILLLLAALAACAAAAVVLVAVFAGGGEGGTEAAPPVEELQGEEGGMEGRVAEEEGREKAAEESEETPAAVGVEVVREGSSTIIKLPDPAGSGDEGPPPGGYVDLAGEWVLSLEGEPYGLENCHLYLEGDGSIAVPDDYKALFNLTRGNYEWDSSGGVFRAEMEVVVGGGSSRYVVTVGLALEGGVASTLDRVEGDFQVQSVREGGLPVSQTGSFLLSR